MVTKKTKTTLECKCEKPKCGKSWESHGEKIPRRCRWCGSYTWNGQDLRGTRFLTALGKTQTLSDWSKESGISKQTILVRLKLGWSEEDAVTIPVGTGIGRGKKGNSDGNS